MINDHLYGKKPEHPERVNTFRKSKARAFILSPKNIPYCLR